MRSRQNPQPAPIETKPPVGYPGASPIPLGDDRTSGLSAGDYSNPAPEVSISRVIG